MHGRHRNQGNGVRSNAMRMEGSARSQGMYNNRNFNRGFGRGSSKPFPPPQPPRKTDIFMEAGRLAAEYLISQGILPKNVLSDKRENVGLNYPEEHGMQERENLQFSSESRTSALARLGNATPDVGFAAFPDDFNAAGFNDNGRGRKKDGPFRSNSSDWVRENGNVGSLLEKSRSFSDIKGADDFRSASQEEQQQVGADVSGAGIQKLKSENVVESESKREKLFSDDDCSNTKKEVVPPETGGENANGPNDSIVLDMESSKMNYGMENSLEKDGTSENETEMEGKTVDNYSIQCHVVGEGEEMSKSSSNLLQVGTSAEVPAKACPPFTWKSADGDPVSTNDEENGCDIPPQEGTEVPIEEDSVRLSSSDLLTNQTHISKCLESDISMPPDVNAKEESVDLDAAYAVEERKTCSVEQSFPSVSFMFQEESGQGPSVYGSCSSSVKDRGEKRAIETDVEKERTKKAREEWSSSMVIDADEYFDSQTFDGLPSISYEERVSGDEHMVKTENQERLMEVDPSVEYKEEKPIFSNSFKICDLNLMEANDMTENHNQDSMLVLPTLEVKTEVPDFSPNNNNRSMEYNRHSFNGKEVIIVDLEDDSADENKAYDTSDRKAEGVYSGLSSFQNNTGSTCDVPDVHDGYGLMISELLGTDITNCSSVSTDITGLQTDMGLHNESGMLCDDDSIYLSLGEIPISFQGVWPEKPFG